MILLIDNFDSFSYNRYQYIGTFTPDIRETLLDTPLERLILKTEDLLAASGQRMQDAAQAAYEEGRLARESYLAILAERKGKEATNG